MQQEKNTEQDAKRQKSCSHSRGVAGLAKTSTLFIAYTHNFFFSFLFRRALPLGGWRSVYCNSIDSFYFLSWSFQLEILHTVKTLSSPCSHRRAVTTITDLLYPGSLEWLRKWGGNVAIVPHETVTSPLGSDSNSRTCKRMLRFLNHRPVTRPPWLTFPPNGDMVRTVITSPHLHRNSITHQTLWVTSEAQSTTLQVNRYENSPMDGLSASI